MGRLFGTDGIRGIANLDLTPDLALNLGRAVGSHFGGPGRSVLVGQDTRRSGDMLSAAVVAGLTSAGCHAVVLGVVTTPCLAHASAADEYAAGIMISASHNPPDDNGLKVVVGGRKIDDHAEDQLARLMGDGAPPPAMPPPGRAIRQPAVVERYLAFLRGVAGDALAGLRIGVDCANGSASVVAPDLLRGLGATVTVLSAEVDGAHINVACGAMHPEPLARVVLDQGLDLGLAFDGDADRLIAVDERGRIVNGDAVMGICALAGLAAGTLRNGLLVATVMSNGGLESVIRASGGTLLRTAVGDRNVLRAMEETDASLGGEQSGHVIFRDLSPAGDGLLTAIQVIRTMRAAGGATLGDLADQIPSVPQVVLNSSVRRRDDWQRDPEFAAALVSAEAQLGSRGRILVRLSGTEAKIRIMVEGDDAVEIEQIGRELAELATARLN